MPSPRLLGDNQAYRRGTLFGFTLAEIVLLVIFALLLAMAALVSLKEKRIAELEHAANGNSMVQIPASEARLAEAVINAYRVDGRPPPEPDDLFRDLRLAQDAKRRAASPGRAAGLRQAADHLQRSLTDTQLDPIAEMDALGTTIDSLASDARKQRQDPAKIVSEILHGLSTLEPAKARLEVAVAQLTAELDRTKQELKGRGDNNLPPILLVPTDNYFRLGEATLVPEFRTRLINEYVPKLVAAGKKFNVQVIEIVGHTDELPIQSRQSNLDAVLLPFLNGHGSEADLAAADNAGLGLARAAAVARALADTQELQGFRILPMSAGQIVDTDQSLSSGTKPANDASRRRIEIRMRRLN